jgi:hypothetical protein
MSPSIVSHRAARIRDLLDRGALAGLRVPLPNGGTLPAEMVASVVLDDLARLSASRLSKDGQVGDMSWRQLAEDIELLYEAIPAYDDANSEHN